MKNKKVAIICNAIAMVCWGVLVYGGIFDGKTLNKEKNDVIFQKRNQA